jgi:hypothetical protein
VKKPNTPLDFQIDKLTNSIENIVTGDSFLTDIMLLSKSELKKTTKKNGWAFNWRAEFNYAERDICKLTIVNNPTMIQGLISLPVKEDHVYLHLIENAPFNRGKNKVYAGVAGNLIAFACKMSFQRGCEGFVSFLAKTNLIEHYQQTLQAVHVGGHLMVINTKGALKLIDKYFRA